MQEMKRRTLVYFRYDFLAKIMMIISQAVTLSPPRREEKISDY